MLLDSTLKEMLMRLWGYCPKHRHIQFYLILVLMLIASLAEVVSIGLVIPFLGILTAPEKFLHHPTVQSIFDVFGMVYTQADQLLLPITMIFIIGIIVAGIIRIALLYFMTKLSFATGADLSIDIYKRTLYQEYLTHISRNSSEVINGIIGKTGTVIGGVLIPLLTLVSSFIILIGVLTVLILIDPYIAFSAFLSFGFVYFVIIKITRLKIKKNSEIIATRSTLMIKSLQEGLGGMRDVLIDGSQKFYCDMYRNSDLLLRRATGENIFISMAPRFLMETIGMVLIILFAYYMTQSQNGVSDAIPVLGALALGAQKLLPILQQAYGSYTQINGSKSSLKDVLDLLSQKIPTISNQDKKIRVDFKNKIQINNLSFKYPESNKWILKNINLSFSKGMRVGFVGETGCGKTTLVDIIMGLLSPTNGEVLIDNCTINNKNKSAWQAHIAHVPQNIYLSDSSIEENIAFAVSKDKINTNTVREVAKCSEISDVIEDLDLGYQTIIGERGVRLSGGQKQRIGIARALYKKASVLFFDEATSALDNKTEGAIMKSIESMDKELTIFMIAHRLGTLKKCDIIVKFSLNGDVQTGSYQQLIEENERY